MTPRCSDEGFTLIEMLVVLSIIAIVAAVSVPYTRNSSSKMQLNALAQSVSAVLQRQRFMALSENTDHQALFNLETGIVTNDANAQMLVIPHDILLTIETARVNMTETKAAIRFFADGSSTGGTISLSKNKQRLNVKVNWFTGASIVEDGAPQ